MPNLKCHRSRREENWQDLLGIYTGVLQNEVCNGQPHKLNLNSLVSPTPKDHNIQHVPPIETYNRFQQIPDPTMTFGPNSKVQNSQNVANQIFNTTVRIGVSGVDHNIQDFNTLQKFASFNQNAISVGSSNVQNFGEVVFPQKVNSLAELMDMTRAACAPPSNGAPNRSTSIMVRPTNICPHSQVKSNQAAHASSVGVKLQQSHVLHSNCDVGGCNLQEMTNSRLSVRNYNLNLPPRPEAGESSSVVRPFPLGPVTPDLQKKSKTYQITQVPQLSIDETSTQEKCTQNNIVLSPQPYILIRDHTENLLNTPSTSAALILTSPKEINNCEGENGGIDLNQTPQQKPPKRKKHRPKVVIEGKRKRGPKPAVTKNHTADGNPKVKRKYVRKNGDKTSTTTPLADNAVNAVEASNGGAPKKSRKRKLNFDSENGTEKESQGEGLNCQAQNNEGGNKLPFNLNLDAHNAELNGPPTSIENENTCGKKKHQTETAKNFVHSINRIHPQKSLPLANMGPPSTPKDHTLNIIARILNMRNVSANQSIDANRYNQVNHCISGGPGQRVIHANASQPNLYSTIQSTVPTMPENEIQGAERLYIQTEMIHPHTITLMGSQLWSNEVSGHCKRDSSSLWKNGLDTGEKRNVDSKFHGTSSCTTDEDFSGQIGSRRNNFPVQSSAIMHQSGVSANSDIGGQSMSRNPNDKLNKVTRDSYMNYPDFRPKFQQQHASSQVHLCPEQVAPKTSHAPAIERSANSLTVVTYRNLGSASQRDPKSIPINNIINSADRVAVKRRTAGQKTSNKVPIVDKSLEQEAKNRRNYRNSFKKVTGSQEERMISVDYITDLLKDLHIYNNGQRALVPYKGVGAVVPYDLVKKRRPRPRVDLDPETNKLWNLLMGKEGGESTEKMDIDKQKWWEEERKVFRGRVDSFIARMHLVQGMEIGEENGT